MGSHVDGTNNLGETFPEKKEMQLIWIKFLKMCIFIGRDKHTILVRAHPGSKFVVANTLVKWKKLEPNEINLSQGFSQKVVATSC